MDTLEIDAPIPHPGQVIKFICQSFSHVDSQDKPGIKKKLDRIASIGAANSSELRNFLFRQMMPTLKFIEPVYRRKLIHQFKIAWQSYLQVVKKLDCGVLPSSDVARILDKHLFNLLTSELLISSLAPIGMLPNDILGKPKEAVNIILTQIRQDKSIYAFTRSLHEKFDHVSEDAWKSSLRRRGKGDSARVSSFLEVLKVNQPLGWSLLVANAYRRYCELNKSEEFLEASHRRLLRTALGHEKWFEALQSEVNRQNEILIDSLDVSTEYRSSKQKVYLLTDPTRPKIAGDMLEAEAALEELRRLSRHLPLLFSDLSIRWLFLIQKRDMEGACTALDNYCEYVKSRDTAYLKYLLGVLLPIAKTLPNKKVLITKWEKWGSFFGWKVDLKADHSRVILKRLFQNKYPEVEENLQTDLTDFGIMYLEDWKRRKPDLQHPNRKVKGFGNIARPQIAIFAGLGHPEKVERLLSKGADVDVKDINGATPLIYAIQGGCDKCIDMILPKTSIEFMHQVTTKTRQHALSAAIDNRDVETLRKLLRAGFDPDLRGALDRTSLYSVICQLQRLPTGPVIYSRDDLRRYAERQYPGFMNTTSPFLYDKLVADGEALFEHQDLIGKIYEFQRRQLSKVALEIIRLLVKSGSDIHAVHQDGYTPLSAAKGLGLVHLYTGMIILDKQNKNSSDAPEAFG